MKKIKAPLDKKVIESLKAGEEVLLSGTIYTARDQAHKRLVGMIRSDKKLPIELKGKVIYYCGPTPAARGKVIGSCGPTTSGRMDRFTGAILGAGVTGLIGKGKRALDVVNAIKKNKAVYFLAPAGCGAYLSTKILKNKVAAFKDLGPEAIYELEVKDFPLVVAVDATGRDVYEKLNSR